LPRLTPATPDVPALFPPVAGCQFGACRGCRCTAQARRLSGRALHGRVDADHVCMHHRVRRMRQCVAQGRVRGKGFFIICFVLVATYPLIPLSPTAGLFFLLVFRCIVVAVMFTFTHTFFWFWFWFWFWFFFFSLLLLQPRREIAAACRLTWVDGCAPCGARRLRSVPPCRARRGRSVLWPQRFVNAGKVPQAAAGRGRGPGLVVPDGLSRPRVAARRVRGAPSRCIYRRTVRGLLFVFCFFLYICKKKKKKKKKKKSSALE
jgi:hypothetical protein